ncbi:hypothetical protein RchiOBHm_Chr5g0047471 [Rosa chinensis]|uniref:Uncharacterized protein n=1 Tax=Rosa chinensis TaxID=74649 RepID=A0A2P6QEB9_ROSCH|nr:hypothetical protein RchiOBHm_Chr5g0047471 [Rosa chinensis]
MKVVELVDTISYICGTQYSEFSPALSDFSLSRPQTRQVRRDPTRGFLPPPAPDPSSPVIATPRPASTRCLPEQPPPSGGDRSHPGGANRTRPDPGRVGVSRADPSDFCDLVFPLIIPI